MDLDVTIDLASAVPPYEQVRSRIAARVADGTLQAGTKLPTVRALAAELNLAVNTVAKAYRALEADRVVETRGRGGTFVTSTALASPLPDLERQAADLVTAARRRGLTFPEAAALLERAWGLSAGR